MVAPGESARSRKIVPFGPSLAGGHASFRYAPLRVPPRRYLLGTARENVQKVGDLEQLGLALLHPGKCLAALALRAVTVATATVCDDGMATFGVLAARNIAAKRRCAAGLDRAHHLQLCVAHVAAIGITPSGAEVAEDVRDFQSGPLHESARLLRRLLVGP